jgi:glutaredoxin 3
MKKLKKGILNTLLIALTISVAIPIGRYLPGLYESVRSHGRTGDFSLHVEGMQHSLTLYGTSTCVHCKAARAYLRNAGVNFNDMVVDKSPEAAQAFAKLGEGSVPVLISKNHLIVGFVADEYQSMLVKN